MILSGVSADESSVNSSDRWLCQTLLLSRVTINPWHPLSQTWIHLLIYVLCLCICFKCIWPLLDPSFWHWSNCLLSLPSVRVRCSHDIKLVIWHHSKIIHTTLIYRCFDCNAYSSWTGENCVRFGVIWWQFVFSSWTYGLCLFSAVHWNFLFLYSLLHSSIVVFLLINSHILSFWQYHLGVIYTSSNNELIVTRYTKRNG